MLKDQAVEKHEHPQQAFKARLPKNLYAVYMYSREASKTQRAHSLSTLVDVGADHRQEEGNEPLDSRLHRYIHT